MAIPRGKGDENYEGSEEDLSDHRRGLLRQRWHRFLRWLMKSSGSCGKVEHELLSR